MKGEIQPHLLMVSEAAAWPDVGGSEAWRRAGSLVFSAFFSFGFFVCLFVLSQMQMTH